jgi:hypothetical protein
MQDPKSSAGTTQTQDDKHPQKKGFFTWERVIEILKIAVTIWAALLGSYVTMQYNQRQNELNRIEAIAQLLPHMSAKEDARKSSDPAGSDDMSRDGAFWAIFRTANNRVMLRDLASLFPRDIYRVVSSIANTGEFDHDGDALCALQVASEKLASQLSADPRHTEMASRLYNQALSLRERNLNDPTPLRVVDISGQLTGADPTDDQLAALIKSINDLADQHQKESNAIAAEKKNKAAVNHQEATDLYKRARKRGLDSKDQQVQEQVARADLELAKIYVTKQVPDLALQYLREAVNLESKITGKSTDEHLKELDKDGDGFAALSEIEVGISLAEKRLKQIFIDFPEKGASLD